MDDQKKVPEKYLKGLKDKGKKGSKEAMKREIEKFSGKDKYKQDWDADYDDEGGRINTKQGAATNAFKKRFGEIIQQKVVEYMDAISLDEDASEEGLQNKAEKSEIPLGILRQVYNKGQAAWNTGHRPGVSQDQWAMGRVNSFITGVGGSRSADSKLWKQAQAAKKKKKK
jgi:hypothetical protein